jgi:hypothetical protein
MQYQQNEQLPLTSNMAFKIQVLAWYRQKNVCEGGGFKWLMESKPFPLDNSISNGNTDINKQ